MAPDTQQNIIIAIQLLISHNAVALLYATGLIGATGYALYKPTRSGVLLMIGFALLLLGFEYQKHIKDALLEQTTNSLITERASYRLERVITIAIVKLAPLVASVLGWGSVIIGSINLILHSKQKKTYTTDRDIHSATETVNPKI